MSGCISPQESGCVSPWELSNLTECDGTSMWRRSSTIDINNCTHDERASTLYISPDLYEILVWRIASISWSYKYCLFSIASWIKFNDCDEVRAFFYHKLTSDSKPNRTTTTWPIRFFANRILIWPTVHTRLLVHAEGFMPTP
jgi:hypothetical protein